MSDHWTEEELRAAVVAYQEMYTKEQRGEPFVKKRYYQALASQFGRTEKSFEFRMQNISHVYHKMGRSWVSGLKPATHVGAHTFAHIERLIRQQESTSAAYLSSDTSSVPQGVLEPQARSTAANSYGRDPQVREWVLKNAAQRCEACNYPAPFVTDSGEVYLEVHHLKGLAEGGSDTINNTVALCPNCHREIHHGCHRTAMQERLYQRLSRLIRE